MTTAASTVATATTMTTTTTTPTPTIATVTVYLAVFSLSLSIPFILLLMWLFHMMVVAEFNNEINAQKHIWWMQLGFSSFFLSRDTLFFFFRLLLFLFHMNVVVFNSRYWPRVVKLTKRVAVSMKRVNSFAMMFFFSRKWTKRREREREKTLEKGNNIGLRKKNCQKIRIKMCEWWKRAKRKRSANDHLNWWFWIEF